MQEQFEFFYFALFIHTQPLEKNIKSIIILYKGG